MAKTGVLLVAFGGPDSLDDVEPFMRSVMGREPSEDAVATATRRYMTIGGASPLPRMAECIANALERRLSGLPQAADVETEMEGLLGHLASAPPRAVDGVTVPVLVGMLHGRPSIAHTVDEMARRGIDRIVWLSLSPLDSAVTTGAFRSAVRAACAVAGVEEVEVPSYHDSEAFVQLLADYSTTARADLGDQENALAASEPKDHQAVIVFTAHSLPVEDLGEDRYVTQLEDLATRVAIEMGLGPADAGAVESLLGFRAHGGGATDTPWLLAYQSKGAKPGEWLGPDLAQVIDALAGSDRTAIALCPIGFVADHLETRFDLDVEAAGMILDREMEYSRARVPNDDPRMIELLEDAASRYL